MKPDNQLLVAWENAVALGHAWLEFAYAKNKRRFHELRREDKHSGLKSHMERELIWRIADGELQAFGVEHGGDTGPVVIPKYYFSKNPQVDWDRETVEAFGKKFHVVRVEGERKEEPSHEPVPSELDRASYVVGLCEISTQRALERLTGSSTTNVETAGEQHEIPEREPRLTVETLPSAPDPTTKSRMGRPSSQPQLRGVVRLLINGNEFNGLSKKEIVTLIRSRARVQFPALFPKPSQPSLNKINEALTSEGWPPAPAPAQEGS